jgi:CheY-like chemotaxis protein
MHATDRTDPLVLVVDDNIIMRLSLTSAFKDAGYSTLQAADGRDALDVAAVVLPDAILMDINMPQLDGIATARILRDTPEFGRVPILAISGNPDQELLADNLFDFVLTKPMRPVDVVSAVSRAITSRKDISVLS